jgi:hypothetical protein
VVIAAILVALLIWSGVVEWPSSLS